MDSKSTQKMTPGKNIQIQCKLRNFQFITLYSFEIFFVQKIRETDF